MRKEHHKHWEELKVHIRLFEHYRKKKPEDEIDHLFQQKMQEQLRKQILELCHATKQAIAKRES